MMDIFKKQPRGQESNCYILTADGRDAIVIDPSPDILQTLAQMKLECKFALLTHGHFDHVGGCGELFSKGAQIICGANEKKFIFSAENRSIFGGVYIPSFEIGKTLDDGEEISLCGINVKTMFTAGHTAGSVCYIVEDNIFTGDTLFMCGVGRCDLPTGNVNELITSLKKLSSLSGDYKIFTGHGEDTTLNFERKYNPYLREV